MGLAEATVMTEARVGKARLKYSTFYESIHAVDSRHGIWV